MNNNETVQFDYGYDYDKGDCDGDTCPRVAQEVLYSENFYATHGHFVFINVTILDVLNTRSKIRGNEVLNL